MKTPASSSTDCNLLAGPTPAAAGFLRRAHGAARPALASAALAAACLLLAGSALASNPPPVSSTADSGSGSLRAAIESINNGDASGTITFQAGLTGTITLTSGPLMIGQSMTIQGPGPAISGGGSSTVFYINSGAAVILSNLTITGGNATGANGNSGDVNGAPGQGGGIFNAGTLTLAYCIIRGNSASGGLAYYGGIGGDADGGGIYNSGALILTNCTLSGNSAFAGGSDSMNSSANGNGGGIYSSYNAFGNTSISGNSPGP